MWSARAEEVAGGRGIRTALWLGERAATFGDVVDGWQQDARFRRWFDEVLADASFGAFRWETPPVTRATLVRPFEMVVLDSPGLDRRPDPSAFAEHFAGAPSSGIAVFPNLGGDAIMIVPCPMGPVSAYGHIGAFVRDAPFDQRDALWRIVGETMQRRVGEQPVWLSTAGGAVSWLHVRLDDRPKYYGYAPYRRTDA